MAWVNLVNIESWTSFVDQSAFTFALNSKKKIIGVAPKIRNSEKWINRVFILQRETVTKRPNEAMIGTNGESAKLRLTKDGKIYFKAVK